MNMLGGWWLSQLLGQMLSLIFVFLYAFQGSGGVRVGKGGGEHYRKVS